MFQSILRKDDQVRHKLIVVVSIWAVILYLPVADEVREASYTTAPRKGNNYYLSSVSYCKN